VGFFFGLMATFLSMQYYNRDQPALLYILPAMLIVYLVAAFGRLEFVKMLFYDEDKMTSIEEKAAEK